MNGCEYHRKVEPMSPDVNAVKMDVSMDDIQ